MQQPSISPRTIIIGIVSFAFVTIVMIAFIEWMGVEYLRERIDEAGPLAPLAYILIKTTTYVFAPLSSGPIQLSSGVLFDILPATLYTLIGEVLGGTISFLIARHLGRPAVRRFVGEEGTQRVDGFVKELGGWRALVYARLFLFAIYDFVSYAAGFTTTITLRQYLLVSIIFGTIPTFLFVAAGASLGGDRRILLVMYALIGILSIVPYVFTRLRHRNRRVSQP